MLPEPNALFLFLSAGLLLLVIPGPAVAYIVARSIEQGRAAGLTSVLGIGAGSMVHVAAAAIGLSAVLVRSATAFTIVKLVGAAYLVFLGVQTLRQSGNASVDAATIPTPLGRVFSQGVWVNVLNPKTAVFFFAFLPQFVDPARGSAAAQIFVLGTLFVVMGIVSDGIYALAAGSFGEWLRARPGVLRLQRRVSGATLIALGAIAAVSGAESS